MRSAGWWSIAVAVLGLMGCSSPPSRPLTLDAVPTTAGSVVSPPGTRAGEQLSVTSTATLPAATVAAPSSAPTDRPSGQGTASTSPASDTDTDDVGATVDTLNSYVIPYGDPVDFYDLVGTPECMAAKAALNTFHVGPSMVDDPATVRREAQATVATLRNAVLLLPHPTADVATALDHLRDHEPDLSVAYAAFYHGHSTADYATMNRAWDVVRADRLSVADFFDGSCPTVGRSTG